MARSVPATDEDSTQLTIHIGIRKRLPLDPQNCGGPLFRPDRIDPAISSQDAAAQATRILANGARNGDVSPVDHSYLVQLVVAKAGIPQADAQKRVDDMVAAVKDAEMKARQAADAARKAAATFAIFTALSLLIGAFVAMAAAAFGGNIRDEY